MISEERSGLKAVAKTERKLKKHRTGSHRKGRLAISGIAKKAKDANGGSEDEKRRMKYLAAHFSFVFFVAVVNVLREAKAGRREQYRCAHIFRMHSVFHKRRRILLAIDVCGQWCDVSRTSRMVATTLNEMTVVAALYRASRIFKNASSSAIAWRGDQEGRRTPRNGRADLCLRWYLRKIAAAAWLYSAGGADAWRKGGHRIAGASAPPELGGCNGGAAWRGRKRREPDITKAALSKIARGCVSCCAGSASLAWTWRWYGAQMLAPKAASRIVCSERVS